MKKFLLPLIAMLFCMTACNKDNEGILKLEVEQYTSNAKVHLDNNYAVWDNGDHIWLNNYEETVSVDKNTYTATISVEDPNPFGIYTAIYPYGWAGTHSWLSVVYPETQTYRTNAAGNQVIDAPMVASTNGSDVLKFKNLGSILAVNVTNSNSTVMNVQKIEVSNTESGNINGEFDINDANTTPSLSISTNNAGSTTTTLQCGGVIIPVGENMTFYIALPSVNAKLNIKVYDDNYIYSKVQTTAHTMEANHGYNAPIASTDNPTPHPLLPFQIKYVTSDGSLLKGFNLFDETTCDPIGMTWTTLGLCTSNVYYGTYGIITFENPITTIGTTTSGRGTNQFCLFYDNPYHNSSNHNITDVYLPEGVISLGIWAFSNTTYTGIISLPSTVTSITDGALNNHVTRLEIHNPVPPTLSGTTYQRFGSNNTILHVPAGYRDAYINSTWGPLFGNGTRIVDDL